VNKIKINFFTVFALGAFFAVFQSNPALAECRAFPKLDFWGNMSHASVQNYVDNRLYGDWGGYIEKLKNIRNGLEKIHRRNRGAVLKLKGRRVTLRGVKLAYYIQKSNERIAVVRCLADVSDIAGLQNFATAAGGNDTRAERRVPHLGNPSPVLGRRNAQAGDSTQLHRKPQGFRQRHHCPVPAEAIPQLRPCRRPVFS